MRRWHFLLLGLFTTMLVGLSSLVYAHPSEKDGLEAAKFDFGLIGDLPYTSEQDAKFVNLINEINQKKLAFVVHDGDFKSGSTLCDDKTFYQRKQLFQTFRAPFIFIPGDNEWTDCHRAK